MGNLLLNSLEIRNFRGFRHLQIEHLGRVNLIVGKNNVGKSSLLEAIEFYASRGSLKGILKVLQLSDEVSQADVTIDELLVGLKYLFYGRKDVKTQLDSIQIGSLDSSNEALSFALNWLQEANKLIPHLKVHIGDRVCSYRIDSTLSLVPVDSKVEEIRCISIPRGVLNKDVINELWNNTSSEVQQSISDSLRMVAPEVEALTLEKNAMGQQIFSVKIRDIEEPLPLQSLGNGMQRVLNIGLALANANNGVLLISEIENSLHYGVQQDLWHMIFQMANERNIQVFATTHSGDCIQTFQQAAQEDKQEEGMLIRLELKKDKEVVTTLFDERRLGIATHERIEVR